LAEKKKKVYSSLRKLIKCSGAVLTFTDIKGSDIKLYKRL